MNGSGLYSGWEWGEGSKECRACVTRTPCSTGWGGWGQAFLLASPDVGQERKNWHLRFINNQTFKKIQNITPAFKGVMV